MSISYGKTEIVKKQLLSVITLSASSATTESIMNGKWKNKC